MILRYKTHKSFVEESKINDQDFNDKKIANAHNHISGDMGKKETSIFLNSLNKIDIVDISNISYLEADGQHTKVVLSEGSTILASKPLSYFQNLLEDNTLFFRCHRSFIVNVKKIKNIAKSKYSYELVMENNVHVMVSFLKKKELNDYLKYTKLS
ncbi:MAG: LytTR family transcriptional regulator DNA-binding domain-containing protein [Bacteroidetes bacterium]|nr:LytTR family transcriptional regulator DNA-binding domain-containing protein [Bacteroidota bacterium]